jgi:hypothetical protein
MGTYYEDIWNDNPDNTFAIAILSTAMLDIQK